MSLRQRLSRLVVVLSVLLLCGVSLRWWHSRPDSDGPAATSSAARPIPSLPLATPAAAAPNPNAASSPAPSRVAPTARHVNPAVSSRAPAVEDRWPAAEVLKEAISTDPAAPEHRQRVRIVHTDFKYPLVRVEETLHVDPQTGVETLIGQTAMVADHVLVKLTPGVDVSTLASLVTAKGGSIRSVKPASKLYLVTIAAPLEIDGLPNAIDALKSAAGVIAIAEPDFIVHTATTPNDPSFAQLYGLHNTGQSGGLADADIDAPEAWPITTGSRSVVVGVIDTGIDHTHPDLVANMWTNPREIPGNGIDDDGNGYVDDVRGWDFVNDDNNPMDDNRHGTHCAGTIGAAGDNGLGVVGVNWQVSLVGLKFLSASGSGSTSDAVEAVAYANGLGIDLTSNSWGGGGYSQLLYDAIADANTTGRLFIAAAGNSSRNTDASPNYPSGYDLPNIIAVAATDHADQLATFSNYGAVSVDLAAPGVNTLSTTPGAAYQSLSGTSMAAPHVAGAAALLKAYRPSLTAADIKTALLASVDLIPSLATKTRSGGRLNAHAALLALENLLVSPAAGWSASLPDGGEVPAAPEAYTVRNPTSSPRAWSATFDAPWAELAAPSGTAHPNSSSSVVLSLVPSVIQSLAIGTHTGQLTITDVASGKAHLRLLTLTVMPPAIAHFDLSVDPGWPRTGQWAFGKPAGLGGGSLGGPDPASGHTGDHVFGVNLSGNYSLTLGGPHTLTAGPFNLTGYAATRLQFRRWLNSDYEPFVSATVELSTNGTSWRTLWRNGTSSIRETAWSLQDIDLSAYADNQSEVFLRWTYTVLSSRAWSLSGWNIDDVTLLGAPPQAAGFDPLAAVVETAASAPATLRLSPPPTAPLTVTFTSSAPATIPAPAGIIVPAGATSAIVPLSILDNTWLDGTRTVAIRPSAAGYHATPLLLTIHDDESATLSLELPANPTEGATGTGRVLISDAPVVPVSISLASSLPDAAFVPASVIVPAGATSAEFPVTFPDNTRIEGPRDAVLTASVAGWAGGQATLTVADNDARDLALTLIAGLAEGRGTVPAAGKVALSGTLTAPLTIALSSSAPNKLQVPATVTLAAGSLAATFPVTLPDDPETDGVQAVTVTAAADTFADAEATVLVADNDPASFAFDPILSPQYVGQASLIRITALDINGAPASGFAGVTALSGAIGNTPATVQPDQTGSFINGSWTGAITCQAAGKKWTLRSELGSARGTSNAFTVRVPVVQTVALANNDIVYDPGTHRLYASTPAGTLVPIHPDTGALGTPVTVATTAATHLARATDGSRLWVTHTSGKKIRAVSLPALAVRPDFAIGDSYRAADIAALPNAPTSLAVLERDGADTRLRLYDNGKPRPGTAQDFYLATSMEAGAGGRLYSYNGSHSGFEFRRYVVSAGGATKRDEISDMIAGYGVSIHADGDLIAASGGQVMDGEALRILASLPYSGPVRPDVNAKRVYLLSDEGGGVRRLRAYDTDRFAQVGAIDVAGVSGNPSQLIRMGAGGLAFRTRTQIFLLNTVLVPTADSADLQVTQLVTPNPAVVGRPLNYLVSVRNLGGGPAASVVLANTFPAGATPVGILSSQGSVTATSTQITAALGTLPAGSEVTLRFTITPATSGTATNTVQVSSTTGDPNTTNNESISEVSVTPAAGLVLRRADIGARDVAYHASSNRLLVSLSNTAPVFGNSLLQVDPVAFAPLSARYLGDNPGRIALTTDDQYAYTILDGAFAISRVPVGESLGEATSFPVHQINSPHDLQRAGDIATIPGRPTAVAARLKSVGSSGGYGVGLFENGVLLPKVFEGSYTSSAIIASADGSKLYGHEHQFTRLSVRPDGLKHLSSQWSFHATYTQRYKRLGAHLYTTQGTVFDPEVMNSYTDLGAYGPVEPSLDDERIYLLSGSTLRVFDLHTRAPVGTLALGPLDGYPIHLVRCGARRLAFVTETGVLYLLEAPTLVPPPPLRVLLPARLTEGSGTAPGVGRVEIVRAAEADIAIQLTSSAPGILDVSRNIILPAGQTSVPFDVILTDDAGLNGTRTVTVTPFTSESYTPKPATVLVDDDETATLTVTADSPRTEGSGTILDAATVTLSAPALSPVVVLLASSDTTELQVPDTVTIPPGHTSVSFPLTFPDDDLLDGPQTATLTASVQNYTSSSTTIEIIDNDSRTLTISVPDGISEGAYSFRPVVRLAGKTSAPVAVTITSSDPAKIPSTTGTIPAGANSAEIFTRVEDNDLLDGAQTVTLTVSAPGFTSGTASITVLDDDPATITWSAIPEAQTAGSSFTATLTVRTIDGTIATAYRRRVPVTAVNATGPALLTPASVFVGGTGTASFRVDTAGPATYLRAAPPGLPVTDSNLFSVSPAKLARLSLRIPADTPITNQPTDLTIVAEDTYGNPVPTFTGPATLSLAGARRQIGTGTASSNLPLYTHFDDCRTQVIYPASELGGAASITGLALKVLTVPSQTLNNWTIRIKTTSLARYPTSGAAWESTGWTVVHQSNTTVAQTGWTDFLFTTPFVYNGTDHLLVDFSFNNSSYTSNARIEATAATNRAIYHYSDSGDGDPLTWSGTDPEPFYSDHIPNIRLLTKAPGGGVTPPTTGAFASGSWTGPITFTQPSTNMVLHASAGAISGESGAFDIRLAPPLLASEPVVTGGTTNTVAWTPPATTSGLTATEVQASSTATFASPLTSPWTSATEHTFAPLAEGKWFYRARTRLSLPLTQTWTQTARADFLTATHIGTSADVAPDAVTLALATATEGTGYVSQGQILSPVITPSPLHRWSVIDYTASTPDGTSLTVDVLDAAGTLLAADLPPGTDLGALPALFSQTALRLRGRLTTLDPLQTPSLSDWSIVYENAPPELHESAWSPVVSSHQDATGPSLALLSSAIVFAPDYSLRGTAFDAHGLSAVRVNGHLADSLTDWTHPFTLTLGENVFTVTATDHASPANITTCSFTVTYALHTDTDLDGLPDAWETAHGFDPNSSAGIHGSRGDSDDDGIPNLLEYAFNTDPRQRDDRLPYSTRLETDPDTGILHLIFTYPRLLNPGALVYSVGVSADLQVWTMPELSPDDITTTPNADGLTETVTVRLPASADSGFVRVNVSTP